MKKTRTKKDPSLKYMIAAARKIWRWTPERRQVLARAKVGKGWKCEICETVGFVGKKTFKNGKTRKVMPVQVDHIVPIGQEPFAWLEFGSWLSRLFCALTNLQCICRACHQLKTNKERAVTAADLDAFAERFVGAKNFVADKDSSSKEQPNV